MEIKETTRQELFEVLYTIEDVEYKTELGKRVTELLIKLEKEYQERFELHHYETDENGDITNILKED